MYSMKRPASGDRCIEGTKILLNGNWWGWSNGNLCSVGTKKVQVVLTESLDALPSYLPSLPYFSLLNFGICFGTVWSSSRVSLPQWQGFSLTDWTAWWVQVWHLLVLAIWWGSLVGYTGDEKTNLKRSWTSEAYGLFLHFIIWISTQVWNLLQFLLDLLSLWHVWLYHSISTYLWNFKAIFTSLAQEDYGIKHHILNYMSHVNCSKYIDVLVKIPWELEE